MLNNIIQTAVAAPAACAASGVQWSWGWWWSWWKCDSTDIYNIFGILTFVLGAIGAWVAYRAYRESSEAQQVQNDAMLFQNAVQIYRRYLELAIEHPKFAEPVDYPEPTKQEEITRYEWFVGLLLRACEEILQFIESANAARKSEWQSIVFSQLEFHAKYFATDKWFLREREKIYSRSLLDIIDRIVAEWKRQQAVANVTPP